MPDKRELFCQLMTETRTIREIGLGKRNQIGHFQGGGQIIVTLAQHDNRICQSELAKLVHVRPGSLSQVLSRLERDDMIDRHRDHDDHRLVIVSLTAKGIEKYQALSHEREQFIDALLNKLSIQDCQDLIRISRLMVAGLEENYQK